MVAQRNLYNARLFYQVTVEPVPTSEPGLYDIAVDVVEIQKYQTVYGLRYDTEKQLEGEAQITDTSLFGTANSLSLYTRLNTEDRILRLVYNSPPSIHAPQSPTSLRWGTLVSAGYEREERPTFTVTSRIFTFQRQFHLFDSYFLIGDYSFENLISESTLVGLPVRIKRNLSILGATLVADTRDDPMNARKGYFLSLGNEYAPEGLGSDIPFERLFYQFFYFKRFGGVVWASGLRTGFAFTDLIILPESERFFAGGSYTIRGFELDTVGPRVFDEPAGGEALLIINQELRFPVYKWFGGAVFYDGGNVYPKPGDFSFSDIRHTVGLGIRFNSPFGVIRFDWGINLDPQFDEDRSVIHIGIGQAF
jgi:outer membrane protein assembly factor BamA